MEWRDEQTSRTAEQQQNDLGWMGQHYQRLVMQRQRQRQRLVALHRPNAARILRRCWAHTRHLQLLRLHQSKRHRQGLV